MATGFSSNQTCWIIRRGEADERAVDALSRFGGSAHTPRTVVSSGPGVLTDPEMFCGRTTSRPATPQGREAWLEYWRIVQVRPYPAAVQRHQPSLYAWCGACKAEWAGDTRARWELV